MVARVEWEQCMRDVRDSEAGAVGRLDRGALRDPVLLSILALGLVLRAATAWGLPSVAAPDETFQYVEQAYRLLTGRGLVPWEYVLGVRSWLLPLMAAPPVALGRALSPDPAVWYGCVTAMMIALSGVTVVGAYRIGRAAGARTHGLWAAFVTAIWCEGVYWSTHFLADSLGAMLLVASLAAAAGPPARSRRADVALGALLGLTFLVRMQLGPALGLIGLASLHRARGRNIVPLTLGALVPLLLAGALDWAAWGAPFRSFLAYLRLNSGGVADSFGVQPPLFYLQRAAAAWGWTAVPILGLAALGTRRAPLLLAVVLVTALAFSLVPHKEYRFVHPAIAVLFVLAGIGTAEAARGLGRLAPDVGRTATVVLALGWCAVALGAGLSGETRRLWRRESGTLAALRRVDRDPGACGLAVTPARNWPRTGRSRLRDDIGLYTTEGGDSRAYDYVLTYEGAAPPPAGGFAPLGCGGDEGACLWRREGPCTPGLGRPLTARPLPSTEAALARLGRR
jgi:hypothetical protein